MIIGTPLTEFDFADPSGLFSLPSREILEDEWGEMRDIEIVTLSQYLTEKASEEAWTTTNNEEEIDSVVNALLHTKYTHAREFVKITPNKFIIGINAKNVNKQSIRYAFDLLSKVKDLQNNKLVKFGESIKIYEIKTQ